MVLASDYEVWGLGVSLTEVSVLWNRGTMIAALTPNDVMHRVTSCKVVVESRRYNAPWDK
jgi:hypothetical protein